MLNAAWGDELVRQGNELAIPMAIRHDRSDVPLRSDALGTAFPEATSKLAVFVHGLSETEESWRRYRIVTARVRSPPTVPDSLSTSATRPSISVTTRVSASPRTADAWPRS